MAEFKLGRIRFVWKGPWTSTTPYVRDDVVEEGGSSYVALEGHTAGSSFATDLGAGKWELMAQKGADAEPNTPTTTLGDIIYRGDTVDLRLPIGTQGQALMVGLDGVPEWTGLVEAHNVYYVSVDGDDSNDGKNLNKAFATIKHACEVVVGPAVIHVKTGTYKEILPIKVPTGVTIQGDGQRVSRVQPLQTTAPGADVQGSGVQNTISTNIVINHATLTDTQFKVGAVVTGPNIIGTMTVSAIQANVPAAGFDTITISHDRQIVADQTVDLVCDYSYSTMWQLGDATMLNKLFFVGMRGFDPDLTDPENINAPGVTLGGVFVAFDPLSPILNKSPYVLECAAFSNDGGIGAIVNGGVHTTGLKSMVFHGYTIVNDGGVGYWINGQGKAEIVSCFTYYCWFGYTTTNGGKIRALNGNNSYGTYGVVSRGFDQDEDALTGTLYGECLEYLPLSLEGGFLAGQPVAGQSSGATGTILNVQASVNKLYYRVTSGTFQAGEVITSSNGTSATLKSDGIYGQKGYVLVVKGLSEAPKIGGSIEFAAGGYSGDPASYVIQSYSGTWVDTTSTLVLVLAQEKIEASPHGESFVIRYLFSQCRLTGHDFLQIGTGKRATTNYPGLPLQQPSQGNEVVEKYPGRVYYVSTDQDGNFRVGEYFHVDQATGRATLNASAFDLAGLTSLKLGSIGAQLGETINEFSSDFTLSGDANTAVPTEYAVRHYFETVDTNVVIRDPWMLFRGTNAQATADADGLSGLMSYFLGTEAGFGQVSIKNTVNDASTDLIAYANNGDNNAGWIDMGITGSAFSDTTYGVTGANDGYIFMSAPAGSTGHGNLYLSTSDNGTQNDIVFSTNGFMAGTERARIIGEAHDGYDPGLVLHGEIQAFGAAIYQGAEAGGATAKDLTIDGAIVSTTLSGSINSSVTTVPVTSVTGLRTAGTITIGTEDIYYASISGSNLINCTRGVGGTIAASHNAGATVEQLSYAGFTSASGVFTGDANEFVQFALKNHNNGTSASTDIIAYASNGDNASGWIDMGITSGTFTDGAYSVTGPDDGYIFMSAPEGAGGRGNLFLSTSRNGTQNDIVFSTDGFDPGAERMRIVGLDRPGALAGVIVNIPTQSTSATTGALRVTGGIGLQGNLNVGGNVAITGTITVGGSGSALQTQTLNVSDPMIKMGSGNAADTLYLGWYGQYSNVNSTLSSAIDASVTSIPLASVSGFPTSGYVYIGSEEISYSGITGLSLTGCTRGTSGTTAASHNSGVMVYLPYYTGCVRDPDEGSLLFFKGINTASPTTTIPEVAEDDMNNWSSIVCGTIVNSGTLSTLQTTANVYNGSATTLNIGGSATAINVGSITGTVTINNPTIVGTQTTQNLWNSVATTVNFAGAATTLSIGASSGTSTINNGLVVSGLTTLKNVSEVAQTVATPGASTTQTFGNGSNYFISGLAGNFTFNWTSVPTTSLRTYTLTLVLAQGATAYICNALQINSSAVTISWAGGVTPTGRASKTDVITFVLYYSGSAWTVLGQLSSYG